MCHQGLPWRPTPTGSSEMVPMVAALVVGLGLG